MKYDPHQIIKLPLITEKATNMRSLSNQYVFMVHPRANKQEIRRAVEELFKVRVLSVNTAVVKPKKRRVGVFAGKTSGGKKAYVALHEGQSIRMFEGA